jgi:hypothetical protein
VCDVLDFHYRPVPATSVVAGNRHVLVEVRIHVRFERRPGTVTLVDLLCSATLLPGEKVRLFTSDRRTRFSVDSTITSASRVSYLQEQTSQERYCMATCYFYRINTTRTMRSSMVAIQRRVFAQAADTWVDNNPLVADGDVSAIPNSDSSSTCSRSRSNAAAARSTKRPMHSTKQPFEPGRPGQSARGMRTTGTARAATGPGQKWRHKQTAAP